jgi:septum site-determining protein MinC
MDSDAVAPMSPVPDGAEAADASPEGMDEHIRLKGENDYILITLPATAEAGGATSWPELFQQLKHRLEAGERFWQDRTVVRLLARDRLLDVRQLQELSEALLEAQLDLRWVLTSRRQTAMAAITAGYSVEQLSEAEHLVQTPQPAGQPLEQPLYLQTTLRSGVEIRHAGTIVLLGDANPGSSLVAEGDILVWGRLRGTAHAGSAGDTNCRIMALQMRPTQLRIADRVARAPDNGPTDYLPEVAYIGNNAIRIAQAQDFALQHLNQTLDRGVLPT